MDTEKRDSQATGKPSEELRFEVRIDTNAATDAVRQAVTAARRALMEARRVSATRESPATGPDLGTRLTRPQRRELTRELLLDAAVEVFARKGYHGASLDDVAEAAGFTKGAVYSNFATKAELFAALLERDVQHKGRALGRVITDAAPAALPEIAQRWLVAQAAEERDWDILKVEFWLAAMRDPRIRERLVAGRRESLAQLGAVVERKLEESGARTGFSGEELVRLVDALGSGLLMNLHLDPDEGRGDLFARAVRRLLADEPEAGAT